MIYDPVAPNAPVINAPGGDQHRDGHHLDRPDRHRRLDPRRLRDLPRRRPDRHPLAGDRPHLHRHHVPGAGSYTYSVIAVDGAGNSSLASNAKTVVYDATTAGNPGAPQAAATPTKDEAGLTFTAATDNTGGAGIARYDVYRSGGAGRQHRDDDVHRPTLTHQRHLRLHGQGVDGAGNEGGATGSVLVVYDNVAPTAPDQRHRGHARRTSRPVLSGRARPTLSDVITTTSTAAGRSPARPRLPTFTDTPSPPRARRPTRSTRSTPPATSRPRPRRKVVIYDVTDPVPPTVAGGPSPRRRAGADLDGVDRLRRLELLALRRLPRRRADRRRPRPHLHRRRTATARHLRLHGASPSTTPATSRPPRADARSSSTRPPPAAPGARRRASPTNGEAGADLGRGQRQRRRGIVRYDIYRGAGARPARDHGAFTDAAAAANSTLRPTPSRAIDAAGNRRPVGPATTVVYDTTRAADARPTSRRPRRRRQARRDLDSGGADNLSGLAYYAVFRGATLIGTTAGADLHRQPARDGRHPVVHRQGRRPRGQRSDAAASARRSSSTPSPRTRRASRPSPSPTHATRR